ncbi:hypothetical protein [Bacteroides pyogenes]|uniref:hypothetical protein n=1 Tax=Bacteroides pyogenes TaxID=310300 RepID=UPI002FD89E43
MTDFKEKQEGNFRKSWKCFVNTYVYLFLGVKETLVNFYLKLTKRDLILIYTTLIAMIGLGWIFDYVQMKARITTTQWQRDSLQLKVDSIHELHSMSTEYSRVEYR